jgi:hypothetical protein
MQVWSRIDQSSNVCSRKDLGMKSNSPLIQEINSSGDINSWPESIAWYGRRERSQMLPDPGFDHMMSEPDWYGWYLLSESFWLVYRWVVHVKLKFLFWFIAGYKSERFPIGIETWLRKYAPSKVLRSGKQLITYKVSIELPDSWLLKRIAPAQASHQYDWQQDQPQPEN